MPLYTHRHSFGHRVRTVVKQQQQQQEKRERACMCMWGTRVKSYASCVMRRGSTKDTVHITYSGQIYGQIIHITKQIERMNYGYKMTSSLHFSGG